MDASRHFMTITLTKPMNSMQYLYFRSAQRYLTQGGNDVIISLNRNTANAFEQKE